MNTKILNALDEAKYSKAVGSMDDSTQQQVLDFIDEITEMEMKSMKDVLSATQQQNQKLGFAPLKLWFESLTNIPTDVTDIMIDIEKDVKKKGYEVEILQPGNGTTLETINGNLLDVKTVQSQVFKVKKNNSGSIYGSGISTQSQYTNKLIYKVKTLNAPVWSCWDVLTGETWTEKDDKSITSGVIIEMFVPYSQKMINYERFVEDFRWLCSFYDNRNIVNGRTFTFTCSGFGPGADARLSAPLQATPTNWLMPNGKTSLVPKYNTLTLGTKSFDKLSVVIPTDDGDKTVLLENFRFGKRDDNYKKSISDEEWSIKKTITSDIPYLIVYYKDSNQIAFILPLRGSSGLTSLNNVLLEADIAKDDLRPFFTTTDKFGDIDSNLKATLFKELRQYLLDRYPDNDLIERAIQLWLYEVIVNDFGGKRNADLLRNDFGWSFLNDMKPKERMKFVLLEYDSDANRQDFRIFLVAETGGKINKFTKSCIVEVKRNDFTKRDTNQSMGYVTTTVNAVQIVGVSLDIKAKNDTKFKEFFAKANGTGQLTSDIRYDLMEVSEYGFENDVQDKFTSIALSEKNKKKS